MQQLCFRFEPQLAVYPPPLQLVGVTHAPLWQNAAHGLLSHPPSG
jgi:hypothetical protein